MTAEKHAPSKAEGTKKPAVKKAAKAETTKRIKSHTKGAAKVATPTGAYLYAIGRRKSAIAQVRLYLTGKGTITVNGKPLTEHIPVPDMADSVRIPLKTVGLDGTVDVVAVAHGGGIRGQADALKLGIARALLVSNPDYRPSLKPTGVLTRDPREKERKKYGLKKARKSPQWAKR